MQPVPLLSNSKVKYVFIVPHTHWDREWYLPFQKFRFKLVQLTDKLLDTLKSQDYYFTFDGQTIILEDYLEIRQDRKEDLIKYIREQKIAIGPWYLLPDIWLVGQESLIRNLEYSFDLSKELNIPLMKLGYLPDMFGHSRAIPQLIADLTDFNAVLVWRGVPPEIKTVPFYWKSDDSSHSGVLGIYLPFGYGNAASLPKEVDKLSKEIKSLVKNLEPFSPIPIFLLQYGTDHQVPNQTVTNNLALVNLENTEISLTTLDKFVYKLQESIKKKNYFLTKFTGELRSSARAHLLQDTYSTRMWIKQWNQKVEDLLIYYAEPLYSYLWYYLQKPFPSSFLKQAWKWLLRNQPHDSICGCSVDQTHEEMKSRFFWAESITEAIIGDAVTILETDVKFNSESSILVYNGTNANTVPLYTEFKLPIKTPVLSVKLNDEKEYQVQSVNGSSDIVWEMSVNPLKLRSLIKLLPGRQIMSFFINDVSYYDGSEPETCEMRILVGNKPIGDFNTSEVKNIVYELIKSKKYNRFHILITKEFQQTYAALINLPAMSFSKLKVQSTPVTPYSTKMLNVSKNRVDTDFYSVTFNKNGSLNLLDKTTNLIYSQLNLFEDLGDRGDEYTYSRVEPEFSKVQKIKRDILISGQVFVEIQQKMDLILFQKLDPEDRGKRIGKSKTPVMITFRFYRDLPRIDIKTELINYSKDHRLRICFNLPFESEYTLTSTHFGYIKRLGGPVGDETYMEKPSGIQPQKRFIRVEDPNSDNAVTLINKGLPEVELVQKNCLALTLIRSVEWLSRADIPERPEHAGPYQYTPGAQEFRVTYTFEYAFMVHRKAQAISFSEDHSEAFVNHPKAFYLNGEPSSSLLHPLIDINDSNIRISSLRVRNGKILVTLYNFETEEVITTIKVPSGITRMVQVKIDGTEKSIINLKNNSNSLTFKPLEIKMIILE